jgi:hypothetical protein
MLGWGLYEKMKRDGACFLHVVNHISCIGIKYHILKGEKGSCLINYMC